MPAISKNIYAALMMVFMGAEGSLVLPICTAAGSFTIAVGKNASQSGPMLDA